MSPDLSAQRYLLVASAPAAPLLALGLALELATMARPAAAQAVVGTVVGTVVDAVGGEPVVGATVEAVPETGVASPAAATDGAGDFVLRLAAGSYSFRVEHVGYESLRTGQLPLSAGETVTIEIRVGPLPIEMEPLVVRARAREGLGRSAFQRRMEERRAAGQGRFITRADIERQRVMTVNDLLAREPGVQLVRARSSDVVVLRGRGRSCLPALYFDGVPVTRGLGDIDLSNWFQPHMIEGIEIYPTPLAAPAEYRAEGCGVIAIWSRHDDGGGPPFTLRRLLMASGAVGLFLLLRSF